MVGVVPLDSRQIAPTEVKEPPRFRGTTAVAALVLVLRGV